MASQYDKSSSFFKPILANHTTALLNSIDHNLPVLPVMEAFYTLQGEGRHAGKAAYFIRLAGCDVGCVWCDVKESWDAAKHPVISIERLVALVDSRQSFFDVAGFHAMENIPPVKVEGAKPIVVITGGEPLMHDLQPLTQALQSAGYQTNIETSGAHPLSGNFDWICLSPKKFKAPLDEILPLAHELKVVVFNKSDLLWAEQYAAQVSETCMLYLQPEWEKRDSMTPLIVAYIKQHPQWQLSLQSHKYINVP